MFCLVSFSYLLEDIRRNDPMVGKFTAAKSQKEADNW